MMRLFVLLCGVLALVGVGQLHAEEFKQHFVQQANPTGGVQFEWDELMIEKGDGEKLYFDVELALNPEQWAQGLMFREEVPAHTGMLFIFDSISMRSFWMKNTLVPLDILFVEKGGRIHHIHHNARPLDESGITSKYPSLAVLELQGGAAERFGIEVNDILVHPAFRNVGIE